MQILINYKLMERTDDNAGLQPYQFPAGTRRINNVFTTSTRRRRRRVDVVKTLSLRHYCVTCPLGCMVLTLLQFATKSLKTTSLCFWWTARTLKFCSMNAFLSKCHVATIPYTVTKRNMCQGPLHHSSTVLLILFVIIPFWGILLKYLKI